MNVLPAGGTARVLIVVALLAYPLLVHALLGSLGPGWLGLLLIVLLAARACIASPRGAAPGWLGAAGAAYLALLWSTGSELVLKLYPALVSAALLLAFAWTLLRPPSMIERVARRIGMTVSARGVGYMRAVTLLWCAFFAVNALVSVAVTLGGSLRAWTFYNGFLSYVLIGVLFAAEYLFRQAYRRRVPTGH